MENIEKTKALINKMFDLKYNGEFDGEKLAIGLFYEYFERLRDDGKIDSQSQYFSDIKNGQRCVKKWRDLNNRQTPATFEKYLVLASIFSCDFRDIVYLDFDDQERVRGAFEFRFSFEQFDDDFVYVDLPCIRDKMHRGIERFGFLRSDNETLAIRRKTNFDGKTTLDRALNFIKKNHLESTANELLNKLSSVIFAWKTRRAPVSLGLLIMFEQITGINIFELYNPEYLSFKLDLKQLAAYFPESRSETLHYLNATSIVKDKIKYFLEENQLKIHCVKKNTVIVKKNKKYGIIIAEGERLRYLSPNYEYIAGSGDKFYAIENDEVFHIKTKASSFTDIIETSVSKKGIIKKQFLDREQDIAYAVSAIINYGYKYFEIDGDIMVMNHEGKVSIARADEQTSIGQAIKVFENGRAYYGLIVNSNLIIPPIYDKKIIEGEGIYTTRKNGKAVFLNSIGINLLFGEYDDASIFSEGLCVVSNKGKYGYINADGEEAIPLQFNFATDFSEGLACVSVGEKDGYINKDGNMVIATTFTNGYKFSDGLAVVEKGGKCGYIDKYGKEILPLIYDNATAFLDGVATVISCGKLITKRINI